MLYSFVNKAIDIKFRSIESKNRLARKIEDLTSSPQNVVRMTEATFDNQSFIAPIAKIVKKETGKAVEI